MPDDEPPDIFKQGVAAWNKWRASNPEMRPTLTNANLAGAYLKDANLAGASLVSADLSGAALTFANLTRADLTNANLAGASLVSADLSGADFSGADLTDANLAHANLAGAILRHADLERANLTTADLTDASPGDAIFTGALVNSETRGLDLLSDDQRDGLVQVDGDPDAGAQSDAPSRAAQITIGAAKRIIGPANEVLIRLTIPNDLSEAHIDLILQTRRTVADINRDLAGATDQNKLMSGEIETLEKAQKALPVWRETWTTFIAAAAGGAVGTAGASAASFAVGYTAGFIAGVLHDTFSPDSLCIMT